MTDVDRLLAGLAEALSAINSADAAYAAAEAATTRAFDTVRGVTDETPRGSVARSLAALQQCLDKIRDERARLATAKTQAQAAAADMAGAGTAPPAVHQAATMAPRPAAVSVQAGRPGDWNKQLDDPAPNATYVVDDRYSFTTDSDSRTVSVEGTLTRGKHERSLTRQRAAGGEDRRVDLDDGGHLIGNDFLGPSEMINIVAQLRTQNRASALDRANWYALERRWASALSADPPEKVEVSISVRYPENSQRPSSFRVRYRVGSGDWQVRRFKN